MAFKLAEAYVQLSSRGFRGVNRSIGAIRTALSATVGPAMRLASAIAAIGGGVSGLTMLRLSANAETLAVSFEVLLGSAEKAKEMMADINKFAAETPFEQAELAGVTKQLLAFGTAQEDIIPTLRMLGDIGALSGARLNELASIFGKAKGTGVVMTETLDMFLERGIPVGRELAKVFGVAETEIRKLAPTGKITFSILQQALENLTGEGGQFAGGMAKLSKTTGGLWSTFMGNLKFQMARLGDAMVEVFDLKALLASAASGLSSFWDQYQAPIIKGLTTLYDLATLFAVGVRTIISTLLELAQSTVGQWLAGQFGIALGKLHDLGEAGRVLLANWDTVWQLIRESVILAIDNMWARMEAFVENTKRALKTLALGPVLAPFKAVEAEIQESNLKIELLKEALALSLAGIGPSEAPGLPGSRSAGGGALPGGGKAGGGKAGGGKAGKFSVGSLSALADQMQSEAGKRLAERTATATERTAVAVEQMAQQPKMMGQDPRFMLATG